jgi:hypothetical protein
MEGSGGGNGGGGMEGGSEGGGGKGQHSKSGQMLSLPSLTDLRHKFIETRDASRARALCLRETA